MLPVGFEPTISAGERLQSYALDRAATGAGLTPQLDRVARMKRCVTDTVLPLKDFFFPVLFPQL